MSPSAPLSPVPAPNTASPALDSSSASLLQDAPLSYDNARIQFVDEHVDRCGAHWPEALAFSSWTRTVDDLWRNFPAAFQPAFPGIPQPDTEQLAAACQMLTRSIIAADDLMDPDTDCDGLTTTLQVMALQSESYGLLAQQFGHDPTFWRRVRTYLHATASVNLEEHTYVTGTASLSDFDRATARRIAIGKASACKVALAGLASLADRPDAFVPLNESLDAWLFGNQMYDDLRDWRSDHAVGQPSYLLARAAQDAGPLDALDEDALGHCLYYRGHVQAVIALVVRQLEIALDRTEHPAIQAGLQQTNTPRLPWQTILRSQLLEYQRLETDMQAMVASNLDRGRTAKSAVSIPAAASADDARLRNGVRFLVGEHQKDFQEACHLAKFPHGFGFSGEREVQSACLFQRALILEALFATPEPVRTAIAPITDPEADRLIHHAETSSAAAAGSAWSYFPDLPEWPADAGTLAQGTLALIGAGRHAAVQTHCIPALRSVLLTTGAPAAPASRWAVADSVDVHRSLVLERWLQAFAGPDNRRPEALAHALVAFHQSGAATADPLDLSPALQVVRQTQEPDGAWRSTWFLGASYPTHVCVRALVETHGIAEAEASARCVRRAVRFLLETQHANGTWGDAPGDPDGPTQGDAGSTAAALLTLACVERAEPPAAFGAASSRRAALRTGLHALRALQQDDGSWPRHPFSCAQQGSNQYHHYGSRAITTALAVRAVSHAAAVLSP